MHHNVARKGTCPGLKLEFTFLQSSSIALDRAELCVFLMVIYSWYARRTLTGFHHVDFLNLYIPFDLRWALDAH